MTQGNSMTIIPVRATTCKACLHKDHAQILEDLNSGKINNRMAADKVGVSWGTWYSHLKQHVKPIIESAIAPNIGNIAKSVLSVTGDLIDQLQRTTKMVEKKFKELEENETKFGDNKQIISYVALEKMLHLSMETIAKISGELNSSAIINVTNTKIEFNEFRVKVMDILCENCKTKILESK